MRSKFVGAVACLVLCAGLASELYAQEWCGEDCWHADLDASLGVQALEEPSLLEAADAVAQATDTNGYLNVNVATVLQAYQLQAYIQAPLRFNTTDFSIREQDWDEAEDFLRIMSCLRFDFMEENASQRRVREHGSCNSWTPDEAVGATNPVRSEFTYLSVRASPVHQASVGYQSILHGYSAMLEEDHFREGITLEANIDRRFIANGYLSDVFSPTVVGGRVAFRPVQNLDASGDGHWDEYQGWVSDDNDDNELFVEIGVTTVADVAAPINLNATTLQAETGDEALVVGGVDARVRWTSENRYADEFQVIRLELGGEFNQIFGFDNAAHGHLRFYYDVGAVDFFVDGEYRLVSGRYIPSYFDRHYRIQRTNYLLSDEQRELANVNVSALTKRDYLASLPDRTEHAYGVNTRFRFWTEIPDSEGGGGWTPFADLWFFLEQIPGREASGRAGTALVVHNLFDRASLYAEFVQQGWSEFANVFTLNGAVLDMSGVIALTDDIYLEIFFNQTWFLDPTRNVFDSNNDIGLNVGFIQE